MALGERSSWLGTQGWSEAVFEQDVITVQEALRAVIRLFNLHPLLLEAFIQDPGSF